MSFSVSDRRDFESAQVHATFRFAHPVYTPDAVAPQPRHGEISGADRIHFAGAYWLARPLMPAPSSLRA